MIVNQLNKKRRSNCCTFEGCTSTYIVNKVRGLCFEHNELRLKKIRGEKKAKPLAQVSKKESVLKDSMHKMYQEMDSELDPICSGCNNGSKPVQHSHILPQSGFPQFKDKRWNVVYDCQDCHDIWESKDLSKMSTLLNFEERMEVVKTYAPNLYNVFKLKTNDK